MMKAFCKEAKAILTESHKTKSTDKLLIFLRV